MSLGTHVNSIATLRGEAAKYSKYLAYESTGAIYAPDNVNQQLEYLKQIGCDMVQGYYFEKPLPIEEFEKKYQ